MDDNSTQEPQADACNEQQYEGKSFDGRILLDNEPTKQVLSSLESLGETLNSLKASPVCHQRLMDLPLNCHL